MQKKRQSNCKIAFNISKLLSKFIFVNLPTQELQKLPRQLPRLHQWIRTYPLGKDIFLNQRSAVNDVNFQQTLQGEAFWHAWKAVKSFSPGLCPWPRWGSLRRSHKPLSPHPVDAFSVSILGATNSTPTPSRVRRSPCASLKLFLAPLLARLWRFVWEKCYFPSHFLVPACRLLLRNSKITQKAHKIIIFSLLIILFVTLSATPAVTPATLNRAATNFAAWWTGAQWVWAVCLRLLPDIVATAIWTRAFCALVQHATTPLSSNHPVQMDKM